MNDLETMLHELAGEEPESFDVAALQAKADHRRVRRRSIGAALLALIVIAATVGLAQAGRRTQSVEAADTNTVEQQQSDSTQDQNDDAQDQNGTAQEQPAFETSDALAVMQVVDEFMAAIAAGEYEIAAALWEPDRQEGLPSEESQVAHLRQACGDGCRRFYEVAASRPADDGRYEVFFHGSNGADYAIWVGPTSEPREPGAGDWSISWPFTITEDDGGLWIDELFGDTMPDRVTVARSSGFELFENGETRWVTLPGASFDFWVVNGWLHQEGRWVNIANPANTCDYSRATESVTPVWLFEWTENSWVTELAIAPENPGDEPETMFWFCDASYGARAGDDAGLHEYFEDGRGPQSINLFSEDEQLTFADVGGLATALYRADGSLLSDGPITSPNLHGPTKTVGYFSRGEGADLDTVTIRAIESGDITFRWSTDQSIFHFDYDGRFVVVLSHPESGIGPSQPESQRPFLDAENSGLLTVIDVETGEVRERPSTLTGIWLDCATNAPGFCDG